MGATIVERQSREKSKGHCTITGIIENRE